MILTVALGNQSKDICLCPSPVYFPTTHMLLRSPLCSACVCMCVISVWSQCQLQVWKIGAASWECSRDQHLHTPHKTAMWKTDWQALALANTWSVYVESSKDGQLSMGPLPPNTGNHKSFFSFHIVLHFSQCKTS